MPDQVEPGTEEGWSVVDAAVRSARRRLGAGVLSAYAIGSLAHGGFTSVVSDVDFALLTDQRTDLDMRGVVSAIARDVRVGGHALGDRLSVFHVPWVSFADPPRGARFPPIDRYDLMRFGILVGGDDLRAECGSLPAASEIRRQAVDSALRRVTPEQLVADLHRLQEDGVTVHDATKAVLWPVRLRHVCDSGEATGNAAAVAHYTRRHDTRHRSLVHDALTWRSLPGIPDAAGTMQRIADEIRDLHAEVFTHLSQHPGIPRRDEIARLAQRLSMV